jgi:hypothetical protein
MCFQGQSLMYVCSPLLLESLVVLCYTREALVLQGTCWHSMDWLETLSFFICFSPGAQCSAEVPH